MPAPKNPHLFSTRSRLSHRERFILVRGKPPFPLDMLRVDNCVPADEAQTLRIQGMKADEEQFIILRRFAPLGERLEASNLWWKQYNWQVIGETYDNLRRAETVCVEWEERKLRDTERGLEKG